MELAIVAVYTICDRRSDDIWSKCFRRIPKPIKQAFSARRNWTISDAHLLPVSAWSKIYGKQTVYYDSLRGRNFGTSQCLRK